MRENMDKVINHLKKAFEIEKFIYVQNNIADRIDDDIYELENRPYEAKYTTTPSKYPYNSSLWPMAVGVLTIAFFGLMGYCVGAGHLFKSAYQTAQDYNPLVILITLPIFCIDKLLTWTPATTVLGLIIGLFACQYTSGMVEEMANDSFRDRYSEKYRRDAERKNEEIDKRNRQDRENRKRTINSMYEEKAIILDSIGRAKNALNSLYSEGILLQAYRNLPAVGALLGYFRDGLCYELEGPNGAYIIYHNDLNFQRMYEYLEEVLERLDVIERTQHFLYEEIRDCNNRIDSVSSDMQQAMMISERRGQDILEQSRIQSYNAKIAASNSEWTKLLLGVHLLSEKK